jgi:hypothetical protein
VLGRYAVPELALVRGFEEFEEVWETARRRIAARPS